MSKHVIKAEEFVLVDDKGGTLAVLGGGEEGGSTLCFFDQTGARRCLIGVNDQGMPLITLGDDQEHPRLSLSQTEENSGLQVLDKEGEVRVQVGIDGVSNQAFVTLGESGNTDQVALFANEDGSTSVILHNSEGVPAMGLRVHPNGSPALLVEQLGNILERFAASPNKDSADAEAPELVPQVSEESLEAEVPSDDLMVESSGEDQPDAWDKTGLVSCE